jgi:hypothetical protein
MTTEPTPITPTIVKKSEIDKQAEEIKAKRALPPKPGDRVNFHDLKQWLGLLPEGAEDRIAIWIYRMDPVINRQLVDPSANNNIDVIYNNFNSLTEEYMIDRHGGGTYKFVIKDEDKARAQVGGFFEARLIIDMVQYPPKLDLKEVEWDSPKNKGYKSWCRAKKLINENNMPVIEQVSPALPNNGGVDAGMLKMLLDFTAKMSDKEQIALKQKIGGEDAASKSMNELFLEKLKQEDPNKQTQTMIAMITAIKGMQPEVKPDNTMTTFIPLLIKMMDDSRASADRQMNMMIELFKSNKSEPKEEKDRLAELRDLLAIAKELKGGVAAPEKTTTESFLELGKEILPGVLTIVGNITAANAASKGAATPVGVQTGLSGKGDMMSQIQHRQILPAAEQPPIPAVAISHDEATNLITQFEPVIFTKMAQEGWEFGAWVADGFGDAAAAAITKFGPDALFEAAKRVPSFWNRIETTYGEAHLKKWLVSLCSYKEIMEKMDEEDGVQS